MHPHASRTDSTKIDLRQAQLDVVAALASEQGVLSVVAGDLNLAPTSTQYRSFLDDLDWHDPRKAAGWNAMWNFHGLPLGLPVEVDKRRWRLVRDPRVAQLTGKQI